MKDLDSKTYRKLLQPMVEELNAMHRWLIHTGKRMIIVFEGRDTAGKGGAIGVFADALNPRSCRVVALSKPDERQKTQWYFQRYVEHLPSAGELVLFDRSWYNRAGVEHVMGFCSEAEYEAFLLECPQFERMQVNSGNIIVKYWFGCDQSKQEERLAERLEDPAKRWKLSPIDFAAREKYDDYTRARDRMLAATDIAEAPWTMVDMNDQKRGRLNMIRHLLDHLPDHAVEETLPVMPALVGKPRKETYPKTTARVKEVY